MQYFASGVAYLGRLNNARRKVVRLYLLADPNWVRYIVPEELYNEP